MKNTTALVLALFLAACSNAPTAYYCRSFGPFCAEFGDGWTPEDADDLCPDESGDATFGDGVCPSGGGLGRCTATMGTRTLTNFYYAGFGDGTVEYARMTCESGGGAFSPL